MATAVSAVFAARVHVKFTPTTIRLILQAKRQGASAGEAARTAGISRKCLYDWLGRARSDETGIFATFARSYRRAEVEGRRGKLDAIMEVINRADRRSLDETQVSATRA